MKMGGGGQRERKRMRSRILQNASLLQRSPRCFSFSLARCSRYHYFRLDDESPSAAIIAGFVTDDAVENNTLGSYRAEPLRKITFFVAATDSVFELLKHAFALYCLVPTIVIVIAWKVDGSMLKGNLIPMTN